MESICTTRNAFELMLDVAANIDGSDALLRGACALSMNQMENVVVDEVAAKVQYFADVVRNRVHGSQPQAVLAHLHELLFEEEGFVGNVDDYYNAHNAYLPMTLQTKQGAPVVMAVLYKLVAERVGLRTWGVGLPGLFLCGHDGFGSELLVDPFNRGRVRTRAEVAAEATQVLARPVEACDEMFAPVTVKQWLTRMAQHLLNIFGAAGHYCDVAAMLELEMLLWPDLYRLHRDLALVLARVGMHEPAQRHLATYLDLVPDDPQQHDLKRILGVLAA